MPISADKRRTLEALTFTMDPEVEARLRAMTDQEAHQAAIDDPDAQPSTPEQLARGIQRRRQRRLTKNQPFSKRPVTLEH